MESKVFRLTDGQLELLNDGKRIVICFSSVGILCEFEVYPPEGQVTIGLIKRLREETGAGLRTVKLLLDEHDYDEAKQMILNVLIEINRRGPGRYSSWSIASMPVWKRDLIERSISD